MSNIYCCSGDVIKTLEFKVSDKVICNQILSCQITMGRLRAILRYLISFAFLDAHRRIILRIFKKTACSIEEWFHYHKGYIELGRNLFI